MATSNKITSTSELKMTHTFEATPEQVFDAFITPETAKKWYMSTPESCKLWENDPVVGGSYTIIRDHAGTEMKAVGKYLEIDRPRRLHYTFQMPQFSEGQDPMTAEFAPVEKGTELTFTQVINLIHDADQDKAITDEMLKQYVDSSRESWGWMFLGLEKVLKE